VVPAPLDGRLLDQVLKLRLITAGNSLPEGDSRIARQFTAGFGLTIGFVPEGRLNALDGLRLFGALRTTIVDSACSFGRPFGT
jgi:hypothetical protein